MNEAEQEKTPAQGIWCGKMCPELSAPTKEPISASCSKKPQKWPANKPPLFLSLKTDGLQPDALPMWEDNGALRGEYLMHSFGVCPKDENKTPCLSAGSSTGEASLGVCEEQSQAQYIVRRLTPLECERLQGFPDGWTDIGEWTDSKGKVHKESTDSARYKALGNSIAIPPWTYVLQRLSLCCGAKPTMASLFDGIGGFPYIWESLNGKGSCVWASEIEDFPIAVTKYHFPEEVNNDG